MEWIFWVILIIFLFFRLMGQSGRSRIPAPPPRDENQAYPEASRYRDDLPLPGPWGKERVEDAGPWSNRESEYEQQTTRDTIDDQWRLPGQVREPAGYREPAEERYGKRAGRDRRAYSIKAAPQRVVMEVAEEDKEVNVHPRARRQRAAGQSSESMHKIFAKPEGVVAGIIFSEVLQRRGGRAGLRSPRQR